MEKLLAMKSAAPHGIAPDVSFHRVQPHAGVAANLLALVWSAAPTKTNAQVRNALLVTARDIDAVGYDNNTGWGIVQAKAAITELTK
jgi:serine protease